MSKTPSTVKATMKQQFAAKELMDLHLKSLGDGNFEYESEWDDARIARH